MLPTDRRLVEARRSTAVATDACSLPLVQNAALDSSGVSLFVLLMLADRMQVFAERIVVKAVVQALAGSDAPPGTKVHTVLHEGLV